MVVGANMMNTSAGLIGRKLKEDNELQSQRRIRDFMSTPSEFLTKFIGKSSGYKFLGRDLERIQGHIVYLVVRDCEPFYVGMSDRGLKRVFTNGSIRPLQRKDTLYVWPSGSSKDARHIESMLIAYLRPKKNIRGGLKGLAGMADLSRGNIGAGR